MASAIVEMEQEIPQVEADAYNFLRTRECHNPVIVDCPNAQYRPKTLDTMYKIAHKLNLGWTTRAAATAYFDQVLMELRDMPLNALPLLAIGSLLIAAKMEEEEINVPTVSGLLDAAESNASMQELNIMELLILKVWGWNACVVTPMHFLPFFSRVARVYDIQRDLSHFQVSHDLRPERGSVDEVLKDPVAQLASCLAEAASLDNSMSKFMASVVAASAIALSRMHFGIEPHWPHTLGAVSGYAVSDGAPAIIVECCTHMLRTCKSPVQPVRQAHHVIETESPSANYAHQQYFTQSNYKAQQVQHAAMAGMQQHYVQKNAGGDVPAPLGARRFNPPSSAVTFSGQPVPHYGGATTPQFSYP